MYNNIGFPTGIRPEIDLTQLPLESVNWRG